MVKPIKVLPKAVHPVVAIEDSVGIKHGYDEEVEVFPQLDCLCLIASQVL